MGLIPVTADSKRVFIVDPSVPEDEIIFAVEVLPDESDDRLVGLEVALRACERLEVFHRLNESTY